MIGATLRLRQKMYGAGMTTERLADRLGICERHMRDLLKKPEGFTAGQLAELVTALGMNPADLWTAVTGETLKVKDLQEMDL